MRVITVPDTNPDQVWYYFRPAEWRALSAVVRSRIVVETRMGGHATYVGRRDIVAIFRATSSRPYIPPVFPTVPIMPEPSCGPQCTAPVCYNSACPSNQPDYIGPVPANE